jgi:hypothetical protein
MTIGGKPQPRVAVVYSVPLLCEALACAMENIAEVQAFPAHRGDTVGLLRSVQPDAVVVDDATEADGARAWAKRHKLPLVHVSLQEQKVRVLRDGDWEETTGTSAESIRNLLAGAIYGPRREG